MNINYTNRIYQLYPSQPAVDGECPVNSSYQTLPPSWPRRKEPAGPASVSQKLYPDAPNCYPTTFRYVPEGTLYDNDLGAVTLISAANPSGEAVGTYPKRTYYQYKPYPLSNVYARERRRYRPAVLPYPAIRRWTRYPVATPGQQLGDWGV